MDSNNSNPNPSTSSDTSSKYQDILDQYSKQVTTVSDVEQEADVSATTDDILKTTIDEVPILPSPTPDVSSPSLEPSPLDMAVTTPPPSTPSPISEPVEPVEAVPVSQTEEKPPVLAESIEKTTLPVAPMVVSQNMGDREPIQPTSPLEASAIPVGETTPKGSGFFKILFFISLLIFLIVASALALSFINNSKTGSSTVNPSIPAITEPTDAPEEESFCYLNDNKYKVNETFPSADGCNTCTCNIDGTISCTEKDCNE